MTNSTVPLIEGLRIHAVQPLHADRQAGMRCLEQQMNVIVHQAVRETAPSSFLDREPEQAQVRPAIGIVEIHRLLGIPTRIDVVDPTLDLFAGSPRHKR
jgi:hypothetical protein